MKPMNSPPRVLAVAAREPWPLCHGGRLRLFHMLRVLAAQGCAVTLAVPARRDGDAGEAPHLPAGVNLEIVGPDDEADRTPGRFGNASVAKRFLGYSHAMGEWLRANATRARFDAVLLSGLSRGVYAADAALPCIWDIVDDPVLHILRDVRPHPTRWLPGLRSVAGVAMALRAFSKHVNAIVVASTIDAQWMRWYAGGAPVTAVSNGVDAEAFAGIVGPGDHSTIVFIGSLSFPPNSDAVRWFAARVWPRLYQRDAARRFVLVGKQPGSDVRELAMLPGIEIAADVPDVRPYLQRATVAVVPTRKGGGVKNKILEACAAGRAVVASPVAAAGLSAHAGRELLVARSPAEWADSVEALLGDPARADAIGAAGRTWVHREHNWPDVGGRMLAVIRAAIRKPAAAPVERRESSNSHRPRLAESQWR